MAHGRHQAADEPRNDPVEQVTLGAITVVYQRHGAEFLVLDIATQGGEQKVLLRSLGGTALRRLLLQAIADHQQRRRA